MLLPRPNRFLRQSPRCPPAPTPHRENQHHLRSTGVGAGQATPAVREHLGTSIESVAALRTTCHRLLAREKGILEAASPESLTELDREEAALEKRIASEPDAIIRQSLQGAVRAIQDQRRQRELLKRSAERVAAEVTRLTWTLEGLGTQLVRLRTVGAEATDSGQAELSKMAQQLHDEIDAIADALEHVNTADRLGASPSRVVDVESPGSDAGRTVDAVRQRS